MWLDNNFFVTWPIVFGVNTNGYAIINANYRLNVVYPAFDNDIATAIAWTRSHAAGFGANANDIVLMGHSTGGDMVGELGTNPALLASAGLSMSALRCVIVLDGVALDLEGQIANPTSDTRAPTLIKAYGSHPTVWKNASAINNANDGNNVVRWFVVLRLSLATDQAKFVSALRTHGSTVSTVNASSISHGQVISNIGSPTDSVMTTPIANFLTSC